MNALEILQEICRSLNISIPTTLTNGNDTNAQFALACLNRASAQAARAFAWQAMQRNIIFDVSTNHPAYNKSTGGLVLRKIAVDYAYPITADLYQTAGMEPVKYATADDFKKLSFYGGAGNYYFTVMGGEILFLPAPSEQGIKISLQYMSKYPVVETENNSGRRKARFDKDSDEPLLDEELLILGGICKYKMELGLEYDDALNNYNERLVRLKNTDTALSVIRPAARSKGPVSPILPGTAPKEWV